MRRREVLLGSLAAILGNGGCARHSRRPAAAVKPLGATHNSVLPRANASPLLLPPGERAWRLTARPFYTRDEHRRVAGATWASHAMATSREPVAVLPDGDLVPLGSVDAWRLHLANTAQKLGIPFGGVGMEATLATLPGRPSRFGPSTRADAATILSVNYLQIGSAETMALATTWVTSEVVLEIAGGLVRDDGTLPDVLGELCERLGATYGFCRALASPSLASEVVRPSLSEHVAASSYASFGAVTYLAKRHYPSVVSTLTGADGFTSTALSQGSLFVFDQGATPEIAAQNLTAAIRTLDVENVASAVYLRALKEAEPEWNKEDNDDDDSW